MDDLSVSWSVGECVGQSVCRGVRWSVCPVHCGKTADRIRMPFGIIGRAGPRMRQMVGFDDQSTGKGTFGREFRCKTENYNGRLIRNRI